MPENDTSETKPAKPMKPGTLKALRAKEWAAEKARLRQEYTTQWAQWRVIAEQRALEGSSDPPF